MGNDQFQLGRVVQISPEHSTVSVKLASGGNRVWFCAERLYPARQDELPDPKPEANEAPSLVAPMSGKQDYGKDSFQNFTHLAYHAE